MSKPILGDQRPDRELLFRCSCGGDHFLSLSASKWKGEEFIDISVCDVYRRPRGVWQRLLGAWAFFWKTEYHSASVELVPKDLIQIGDWCEATMRYLAPEGEAG